jgi:hypothetical protein
VAICKAHRLLASDISQHSFLADLPQKLNAELGVLAIGMVPLGNQEKEQLPKLSSLLRAKIIEVPETPLLHSPRQLVLLYHPYTDTATHFPRIALRLSPFDPTETQLRRYWKHWRVVLSQLGESPAELVWRRAARDMELVESPASFQVSVLQTLRDYFAITPLDLQSTDCIMSPKLNQLLRLLVSFESYGPDFSALIFGMFLSPFFERSSYYSSVEKRSVARVLVDAIQSFRPELSFIQPYLLLRSGDASDFVGYGPLLPPAVEEFPSGRSARSYMGWFLQPDCNDKIFRGSISSPSLGRDMVCPIDLHSYLI